MQAIMMLIDLSPHPVSGSLLWGCGSRQFASQDMMFFHGKSNDKSSSKVSCCTMKHVSRIWVDGKGGGGRRILYLEFVKEMQKVAFISCYQTIRFQEKSARDAVDRWIRGPIHGHNKNSSGA
jgi:hypothetical protein